MTETTSVALPIPSWLFWALVIIFTAMLLLLMRRVSVGLFKFFTLRMGLSIMVSAIAVFLTAVFPTIKAFLAAAGVDEGVTAFFAALLSLLSMAALEKGGMKT